MKYWDCESWRAVLVRSVRLSSFARKAATLVCRAQLDEEGTPARMNAALEAFASRDQQYLGRLTFLRQKPYFRGLTFSNSLPFTRAKDVFGSYYSKALRSTTNVVNPFFLRYVFEGAISIPLDGDKRITCKAIWTTPEKVVRWPAIESDY